MDLHSIIHFSNTKRCIFFTLKFLQPWCEDYAEINNTLFVEKLL